MKSHRLVSGNPDTIISDGIFEILTGQTSSVRLNISEKTTSINYF